MVYTERENDAQNVQFIVSLYSKPQRVRVCLAAGTCTFGRMTGIFHVLLG